MQSSKFVCRSCARWLKPGRPSYVVGTRNSISTSSKQSQEAATATKTNEHNNSIKNESKPYEAPFITSLGYTSSDTSRHLLRPNNLFHPFSKSPSPAIRKRAEFMRQHAYCPHPSHTRTRSVDNPHDPENRKPLPNSSPSAQPPAHVRFECPDCGIPVACCEEHWADDYEAHMEVCETLREINEDDHDLRSGRFFNEFEMPGLQRDEEFLINFSSWDRFLYTRDHNAINDMRPLRHVTRMLTYPITIASVLHELSPYTHKRGGRLTPEGLRSFSALRYTLHPPRQGGDETMKGLRPRPPATRIFILGARAESSIPRNVWAQIPICFERQHFHLIFLGPEAMMNRDDEFPLPERTARNPFGGIVEDRLGSHMKITTYVEYFHTMHEAGAFAPYDPYFDVFVLFHPGLGHPASVAEWADTLPQLLETKCPIICTGYTEWDMERDRQWIHEQMKGEFDTLLEPGENIFRSLRWDLNDLDPVDISCGNWGVWAFRGKRYEAEEYAEKAQGVIVNE